MSRIVILDISVGASLSVRDAAEVAAAAQQAGVSAIRLLDDDLDASAVAAYLAGRLTDLRWIIDAQTTHNPPYNLARRALSIDRATRGRSGLALRVGGGDEVSEATVPDPSASGRGQRWAEYAHVLTRLWESFPAAALLADQEAGLFVDYSLIRGIEHEGAFYRVAGPLDGPSSAQGRPVLAAADVDQLGWESAASAADIIVVDRALAADAAQALDSALTPLGRRREEISLIGRAEVPAASWPAAEVAAELDRWTASTRLDGLELWTSGGRDEVLTLVRNLLPRLQASSGPTLRAALGLPELIGVRP